MPPPDYTRPDDEFQQGDIFLKMPSVHMEAPPVRVARYWQDKGGRPMYGIHHEGEGGVIPAGGFKWRIADQGGEDVLARGYLGLAMLLSHDCEIENDDRHRTLAMIRPITDLAEVNREDVRNFACWSAFPLIAQVGEPQMEESFVDFRRLTTVRPNALLDTARYARVSNEIREALADRFWHYLFRPIGEPHPREDSA